VSRGFGLIPLRAFDHNDLIVVLHGPYHRDAARERNTDGVAENLDLALRRYCEARLTLVQREAPTAVEGARFDHGGASMIAGRPAEFRNLLRRRELLQI
jgi:hypothetical protein